VKIFGGQPVKAGNIIVRQKGRVYYPGEGTYMGKDFTIHAKIDGVVKFGKKVVKRFDGRRYERTMVMVEPAERA